MRKFKITVNGKEYEVGVEEVHGEARPVSVAMAAPAPGPANVEPAKVEASRVEAPKAKPAAPKAALAPKAGGSKDGLVSAPMPGTISDILVKEGDRVKKGQVLIMLEAMKMQNEIMAGYDGVVTSVHTTKGASVNTGDPLVALQRI